MRPDCAATTFTKPPAGASKPLTRTLLVYSPHSSNTDSASTTSAPKPAATRIGAGCASTMAPARRLRIASMTSMRIGTMSMAAFAKWARGGAARGRNAPAQLLARERK